MGTIRISKTKKVVRKSQTTKDGNGQLHCKTCGAFVGNKGKKKKK